MNTPVFLTSEEAFVPYLNQDLAVELVPPNSSVRFKRTAEFVSPVRIAIDYCPGDATLSAVVDFQLAFFYKNKPIYSYSVMPMWEMPIGGPAILNAGAFLVWDFVALTTFTPNLGSIPNATIPNVGFTYPFKDLGNNFAFNVHPAFPISFQCDKAEFSGAVRSFNVSTAIPFCTGIVAYSL